MVYVFLLTMKLKTRLLVNIFKELDTNYGELRLKSDLSDWADQGVLLLNSVLSVRKRFPGSHKYIGWEKFTDNVINIISREERIGFYAVGKLCKKQEKFIDDNDHLILKSGHPSPLVPTKDIGLVMVILKNVRFLIINNSILLIGYNFVN